MSYSLIYTVPFATIDNVACVVEIEKEGYVGASTELIAGADPFTIDIENEEFLYTPVRFSTAKLQVVGSDYLQTLFSTEYRQYRVTMKKDNVVTWCGFVKPEIYTQDYAQDVFVLEIECMSAMSVLEYVDYKIEGDSKSFVSIWRLLQRCVEAACGRYVSVYIPHVYASSKEAYDKGENIFKKMTISEQNFFDEDNKPMKLKEVLEEVCKFMNWTCADWMGSLYFVDVDHDGIYHEYDVGMLSKVVAFGNELKVQDIGFAGAGHSLDILQGYNKVTVRCSNYKAVDTLPEETFDRLAVVNKIDTSYYDQPDGGSSKIRILMLRANNYKVYRYYYAWDDYQDGSYKQGWNDISEKRYESMSAADGYRLAGCQILKRCDIKMKDGEVKVYNYDYTNIIYISSFHYVRAAYTEAGIQHIQGHLTDMSKPLLKIGNEHARSLYRDGVLAIDMEIGINAVIEWEESVNMGNPLMYVALRVGDYYYDGEKWVFGIPSTDGFVRPYFTIEFENKNRTFETGGRLNIPNTKTLDMPYNGAQGYIIPLPDDGLTGSPELSILGFYSHGGIGGIVHSHCYGGCYIYKLGVKFYKKDGDIYGMVEDENTDRTYENVLNSDYIHELNEIEFKISSYNNDGTCYSKVLLDGDYLTDNLYNSILDEAIRQEEMMITRCINHYSNTRIKLTQEIKVANGLCPITRLSDNYLVDRRFINTGGTIDYKMNRFEYVMIEL